MNHILCLIGFFVIVYEPVKTETWELANESDGIRLYYRWVNRGDTLRTREMKAEFVTVAEPVKFIPLFTDSKKYRNWAPGIKDCTVEIKSPSDWYTYNLMDYPWPFKQKDLCTYCRLSGSGDGLVLSIDSSPGYKKPVPGISRIADFEGQWSFTPVSANQTLVTYRVVSFEKPVFPRFIQDPVIQNLFFDSLINMKKLAEGK